MKQAKRDTVTDIDVALYALYLLGGWEKRIHTEDVALKCYELAPSKFSWVKYPDHPDLQTTRFALEAAKKAIYGRLARGQSERKRILGSTGGWMLTANGIHWIRANMSRIEQFLGKHHPVGDRLSSDRKLKELLRSTAFRKFMDQREQAQISHAEFAESLVCTVNTRPEMLDDRLEKFYSVAEELRREDLRDYVNFCRERFARLLRERGGEKNAEDKNSQ